MKSGVYKITSLIDNTTYIGSSIDVMYRYSIHISTLRDGKHHNMHLQHVFNKYGEGNLQFEVIEYCEKELRIEREQHYIDLYIQNLVPLFNQVLIVERLFLYDEESIRRRSISIKLSYSRLTEEEKQSRIEKSFRNPRAEAKRLNSVKLYFQNNTRQHLLKTIHSEAVRQKQRENHQKPVVALNKLGEVVQSFDSLKQAAQFVDGFSSNIQTCCSEKRGTYRSYQWRYKKDLNI